MLVGNNNEEKIWNFLVENGYTRAGASGIMGNLYAESGLRSNNIENRYESDLGSDTYYTDKINNGNYTKEQFMNDNAGYGLAQWTYYSRKQALYEHTVERDISIDDLESQLEYLVEELSCYRNLNAFLKSTNNINDASDRFLKEFEKPAVLNYKQRRKMSYSYYTKFVDHVEDEQEIHSNIENGSEDYKVYEVKPGDSWWSIASDKLGSGTKMVDLAEFNGKTIDDMLHPKDVIVLPIKKEDTDEIDEDIMNTKYFTMYEVKYGDSWWSIACNKLGSGALMEPLAKFNDKNIKDVLYEGAMVKIPCKVAMPQKFRSYTVKKGDSWWRIASNEMGSASKMEELAKFNGVTTNKIIYPGNVLKIPM